MDVLDGNGQTPLHNCVNLWKDSHLTTKVLFEHGARHDIIDKHVGFTPLHYASINGHLFSLRLLLEKCAAADVWADSSHYPGANALHLAADHFQDTSCNILLRHDAQLNNATDALGRKPIHYAAGGHYTPHDTPMARPPDTCMTLLQYDPQLVTATDWDGRTPLHHAAKIGNCKIISLLLSEYKANPNALDSSGRTPLQLAQQGLQKEREEREEL